MVHNQVNTTRFVHIGMQEICSCNHVINMFNFPCSHWGVDSVDVARGRRHCCLRGAAGDPAGVGLLFWPVWASTGALPPSFSWSFPVRINIVQKCCFSNSSHKKRRRNHIKMFHDWLGAAPLMLTLSSCVFSISSSFLWAFQFCATSCSSSLFLSCCSGLVLLHLEDAGTRRCQTKLNSAGLSLHLNCLTAVLSLRPHKQTVAALFGECWHGHRTSVKVIPFSVLDYLLLWGQ